MKLTAYENGEVVVEQTSTPIPTEGELLLKVKACGICGSDIPRALFGKAYYYPIVIGHEFAGVVEWSARKEWIGKRVCVFPILPCKRCENCKKERYANCSNYNYYGSRKDGGMQDYLVVKEENVLFLPDNMSYEAGAMVEPTAVCLHATKKAQIQQGENVLIYGAGTIGLLCGMWAKDFGAKEVYFVDIDQNKLQMAEKLGFKRYNDENAQVVMEASGAGACLNQAIETIQPFGRIVIVGNASSDVTIKKETYAKILRKQLSFMGSWNSDFSSTCNDWQESIEAIAEKRIQPELLITHTFELEESEQAFALIKKREFFNKIMVVMK